MELQRRHADITRQGLGLVAVSYDSPETLKKFADSRGITFPLIADQGSAIIRAYGLLNDAEKPGARGYGIPHPGTFIVNRQGIVVSRFFEDAYQERYTAATILSTLGGGADGARVSATTPHLSVRLALSGDSAAPGERLALVADVTPARGMHLYAPGKHDYQVVRLTIESQPWVRLHDAAYPPPEIYHFVPLDERVEVFSKPFRLRRDVTLLATPDAQQALVSQGALAITGALEYQACDDKVCYSPSRVPFTISVKVRPLDRRPPG